MAPASESNGKDAFKIASNTLAEANPVAELPSEIASNINYHAKYSPHFSAFKFEPEQAYYATAESVRDRLIKQWNETYLHFHKTNPKQTYYLSMEYLQGRALTNAVGNLNIQDAYAEALNKLGHELEDVVEQEKDPALGNGGLGRLASCFLDSMATLNLPAWGYGLRYRYGLFKQRITKEGQEEVAEDWLEKFSPWEIVRHDVVYPVRFESIESIRRFRASQFELVKAGLKAEGEIISVNMAFLKAGTPSLTGFVMNLQPSEAEADFNIRIPPTADHVALERRITEEWAPASRNMTFEFKQKMSMIDDSGRPLLTAPDNSNPWWTLLEEAIKKAGGTTKKPEIFPATTDAYYFRLLGFPAFGFSPMANTPILLHDHNELLDNACFSNVGLRPL